MDKRQVVFLFSVIEEKEGLGVALKRTATCGILNQVKGGAGTFFDIGRYRIHINALKYSKNGIPLKSIQQS